MYNLFPLSTPTQLLLCVVKSFFKKFPIAWEKDESIEFVMQLFLKLFFYNFSASFIFSHEAFKNLNVLQSLHKNAS